MVLVRYSNLWAKSLFTINENSKLEICEQYFLARQFEKKGVIWSILLLHALIEVLENWGQFLLSMESEREKKIYVPKSC